jgi:hypothetical protein
MKLSRLMAFLTLSAAHMYVVDDQEPSAATGTVQQPDPDAPLSAEHQTLLDRIEALLRYDAQWITAHVESLIASVESSVTNKPLTDAANVPPAQPTVDPVTGQPVIPAGTLVGDPAAGSTLEPGEPVKSGDPEVKDE